MVTYVYTRASLPHIKKEQENPQLATEPKVTIGICCYNAETTINAAIDSALAQDWPNFEIICIDDASSDKSWSILSERSDDIPSVRAIRHETNTGVAACRNRILSEASGDYICFFDDDDVSAHTRITEQVYALEHARTKLDRGAPTACYTARLQFHEDGSVHEIPALGDRSMEQLPRGRPLFNRLFLGDYLENGFGACATCSLLMRTADLHALGGFNETLRRSEDFDLVARIALADGAAIGLRHPLVEQKMTGGAEKSLHNELEAALTLVDIHRKNFTSGRQYIFARYWMKMKFAWLWKSYMQCLVHLCILVMIMPMRTPLRLLHSRRNITANLRAQQTFSHDRTD